jgi:putative SOS response-associated peptidase YedK
MPVMLADEAARRWLAPGPMTKESLAPFVQPFPAEAMRSYRVNPLLNSVRQESAEAAAPATADQISAHEGDASGQGELLF